MQFRVFRTVLIDFIVFDILKLRTDVPHRKGSHMTQKQLEYIETPDTAQAELAHAKAFVIRQIESSADMALLDLIAKLLLHES